MSEGGNEGCGMSEGGDEGLWTEGVMTSVWECV